MLSMLKLIGFERLAVMAVAYRWFVSLLLTAGLFSDCLAVGCGGASWFIVTAVGQS